MKKTASSSRRATAVRTAVLPGDARGRLDALDRAQALIEFTIDGTIRHANARFLSLLGLTLEDVQGKPHEALMEPGQRDGEEHARLWARLARGEPGAGRFRYRAADGRQVWLRVGYCPVLGAKGKVTAVTGVATDVTEGMLERVQYEGYFDAIDKVQGIIEFSPDGTILHANANFLRAVGYSMEEIRGKHHSLFIEPAQRDSAQYQALWAKLGRGEHDEGEYLRIGAGGRRVWLQASYNPIPGVDGKPCKVVKFATDITARKAQALLNAAFKGALDHVSASVMVADMNHEIIYANHAAGALMKAAEADFRKDLPHFDAGKLVGSNIDVFHRNPVHQRRILDGLTTIHDAEMQLGGHTVKVVVSPMLGGDGVRIGTVVEMADRTQEVAVEAEVRDIVAQALQGRLDRRVDLSGKQGFYQQLSSGINELVSNMAGIVSQVKMAASEVSRGADEISQGNTNLSQRTEEQASSLEETASSMEQMTSTVKQNADNASQANQLAVAARDQAEKGGAVVMQAVKAMTEISEDSRRIADIIGVIDEIAFQTNLLALNAAVEAARAGEQGRGFAVVATEVRNLASRSATAAKEIKTLIQASARKVEEGSTLVTQSGTTLEQIVASVKKVTDIIAEIAAASAEQSTGIEQVNKAVMQLDELTQQNAALVEQASAASQSMAEQARGLDETMQRYTVDGSDDATSTRVPVPSGAVAVERRQAGRPWSGPRAQSTAPVPAEPVPAPAATGTDDAVWKEF